MFATEEIIFVFFKKSKKYSLSTRSHQHAYVSVGPQNESHFTVVISAHVSNFEIKEFQISQLQTADVSVAFRQTRYCAEKCAVTNIKDKSLWTMH